MGRGIDAVGQRFRAAVRLRFSRRQSGLTILGQLRKRIELSLQNLFGLHNSLRQFHVARIIEVEVVGSEAFEFLGAKFAEIEKDLR